MIHEHFFSDLEGKYYFLKAVKRQSALMVVVIFNSYYKLLFLDTTATDSSKDCKCPCRDFAQEAKSRRGILVDRTYIKKSTYSSNIQSVYIYQKKYRLAKNWDCMELLGNDDVSALNDRKYEMVKDDVNPKQEMLKGTSWVDFVTFIV